MGLTYLAKPIYLEAYKGTKNADKKAVNAAIMLSALFAEKIGNFRAIETIPVGSSLMIQKDMAELKIKDATYRVDFRAEVAAQEHREEGESRLTVEMLGERQEVRREVGHVADMKAFLEDQMALRQLFHLPSRVEDPSSGRAMLTTSLPVPAKDYAPQVAKNYPGYYFGRVVYGNVGEESDTTSLTPPDWTSKADFTLGIHPTTGEVIVLDQNYKKIGTCTNISGLPRLLRNLQPTLDVAEVQRHTPLTELLRDVANQTDMMVSRNVSWPHFDLEAYIVTMNGTDKFYVAASGKGADIKYKLCKDNFQGPVVENWTSDRDKIIEDLSKAA